MEEKSYNTWKQDPANPYNRSAYLQLGLKHALQDELPEVEYATRFRSGGAGIFRFGNKVFTEKLTYIDADFFKMFSFRLISGNSDKLFQNKSDVVLTPAFARKYFGDQDPIGKAVLIDNEGERSFIVAGIIEPAPANSSLSYEILLPQETWPNYDKQVNQWGNFSTPTFVQLVRNTNLEKFRTNLDKVIQKYMGDRLIQWRKRAVVPVPDNVKLFELEFSRLTDIHLKKEIGWDKVSDRQYSFILGGIAVLILLIACINYVSLALTSSASRRTEVGVRKVVGAQKKQLMYQFGLESIMLTFISMILGIGLVYFFLPAFNDFTGKGIIVNGTNLFRILGVSLSLTLLVGILAGSYPSFFLSGFRPALVLKGRFTSRVNTGLTQFLVGAQFFFSAALIISSVIMYRQMRFVTTHDLGYNKEQVVVIPTQTGWTEEANKTVERFRARTQQDPFIVSVSGTSSSFNQGYSRYGYKIKDENKSAYVFAVDAEYINTLGIEIAQGRNFDARRVTDTAGIIVNEALVKDMGWKDPLNEHLNWKEDSLGIGSPVIGVVKDYHFLSLEENIEPMFLSMDKKNVGYLVSMLVRIAPGEIPGSIEKIKKIWQEISPDKPFDYTFLDQDVAKQYESHQRWMGIMGLSTGLAILIACLGLFGLAGINVVNRTREIGIRKVMGAELHNIFVLLNKQYVWLSLIAFAFAAPVSWYFMSQWLSSFKFAIQISWELFAASMAAGLLIALVTVSYHAIQASLVNPAETLKYE